MENPKKSGLLALVFLITTEIMFFAGLLSAYGVLRSGLSAWPPPGQPRYPVSITAINSLILLASLFTFYKAEKKFRLKDKNYLYWLAATLLGGSLFLAIQGIEWFRLIKFGMKLVGNVYGGLFYLIVGSHAMHALVGLLLLIGIFFVTRKHFRDQNAEPLHLMKIYWAFVVLLWPVIYVSVYLI